MIAETMNNACVLPLFIVVLLVRCTKICRTTILLREECAGGRLVLRATGNRRLAGRLCLAEDLLR